MLKYLRFSPSSQLNRNFRCRYAVIVTMRAYFIPNPTTAAYTIYG